MAKELVFNPEKYAEICAKRKKSTESITSKSRIYGGNSDGYNYRHFNDKVGYGKLWDAVNDYYSSREW